MNQQLLEAELRRDEGVRYAPYTDTTGNRTIGVGHNMDVSPLAEDWTIPLTDAQVDQLLASDIASTVAKLDRNLAWWQRMSEARQRVLANMCFNLGIGGLLTFKNALSAMRSGSYVIAADRMKASKWYQQTGGRAQRLCEAMKTGVMPDEPDIA